MEKNSLKVEHLQITKESYPSIDLAYSIALNSYDWSVKRFDALDSKIQTILAVVMTISLAVPVGFSALKLNVDRRWIGGAVLSFVLAISVGTYSRLKGKLIMLSPSVLHQKWLALSEPKFKTDMIYFAGQHFEKNAVMLDDKHFALVITLCLFALEILCLALSVLHDLYSI